MVFWIAWQAIPIGIDTDSMAQNRKGEPNFLEMNTGFSTLQNRGFTWIFRNKHRLFRLSGTHEVFLQRLGRSYYLELRTRSGNQVEWRRDHSHGSSRTFYFHALGLTLVTLGNAYVPTACIPFAHFPCQELRIKIKHKMHMFFGIIIKYYSQGLSP